MASTLPKLAVFEAISKHDPKSTAVVHSGSGRRFTYGELLKDVAEAKDKLHAEAGSKSIEGQRIAFLVENSYDYIGAKPQISCSCHVQEPIGVDW
jgi:malonyl-CoA/methylmalonyl-CoA synthetase